MLNSRPPVELSAVIVNWNSGPYLGRLLDSLQPLAGELGAVLVLDNASRDSSPRAAQERPWAQLSRFERNRGFAAAANAGIRDAPTEFILLLNPDIEVDPDSVRALYETMQDLPRGERARLVSAWSHRPVAHPARRRSRYEFQKPWLAP